VIRRLPAIARTLAGKDHHDSGGVTATIDVIAIPVLRSAGIWARLSAVNRNGGHAAATPSRTIDCRWMLALWFRA
jgi:hypothetical protein